MLNHLPLPLFLVGLAVLYVGERALQGTARYGADVVACALLAAALAAAAARFGRATAQRRQAHGWVLLGYGVATLGLGLYAAVTTGAFSGSEKLPVLLQVVWPGLVVLGLLPTVAMELAIGSMQRTPTLELWRVRLASRAARIMGLALVAFAGINYTAATWNHKLDLSYFKTTKVGSATRNIATNLTQPVKIFLFFPPGNDVLEQARAYFDDLATASNQVQVQVLDQALEPEKALDMKVRSNGYLAIKSGNNTETLRLDLDAEEARGTLRNLDAEVQQRLLKVIRPGRIAYFTTGHMERDYAPPVDDRRLGLADFKILLEAQGFSIRRLGLSEGLGSQVPKDATIVCVMGPTEAFTAMERAALTRYLQEGGRAIIALDPDHGVTEDELLAPWGLQLSRTLVANDHYLVRLEGQAESPYNMVTTRTTTHPVVTTMDANPGRLGLVFLGAGSLHKREPIPPGVTVTFPVHAMGNSWEDKNGNGKFDAATEQRNASLELAAAVELAVRPEPAAAVDPNAVAANPNSAAPAASKPAPPMRALVVADVDFAVNGVVRNPGNAYFVVDALRWLAGDEKEAGVVESEKDIPIVHRKDEDAVWFYGTSFLFPVAVLVGGLMFTRRSRRPRRRGE
jgi:hypothetical protein